MTMTEVQARTTQTAAYTGASVDVSGITQDWTLKLQVEALTAADNARFVFEDTINDWTASVAGPTCDVYGLLTKENDKVYSWKKADFPSLRLGTVSAGLRLKLGYANTTMSVTYRAWLEY